jgi:hypothetical protein
MLSSYQRSLLSLGDAPRRLRVKKAWLCALPRAERGYASAFIFNYGTPFTDSSVCDVAECQWMQTGRTCLPSYEPSTLSFDQRLKTRRKSARGCETSPD